MLHAAAKTIVNRYGGKFPATVAGLRELPGIGRYTAAAIASIAFDEPAAVVDGNVERVLGRVFGDSLAEKDLWQAAEDLLSPSRPGDFNQAMMELGATVCLPRQPLCSTCPVFELCLTHGKLVQQGKTTRQIQRRSVMRSIVETVRFFWCSARSNRLSCRACGSFRKFRDFRRFRDQRRTCRRVDPATFDHRDGLRCPGNTSAGTARNQRAVDTRKKCRAATVDRIGKKNPAAGAGHLKN